MLFLADCHRPQGIVDTNRLNSMVKDNGGKKEVLHSTMLSFHFSLTVKNNGKTGPGNKIPTEPVNEEP